LAAVRRSSLEVEVARVGGRTGAKLFARSRQ
jgi:hypothetical protein